MIKTLKLQIFPINITVARFKTLEKGMKKLDFTTDSDLSSIRAICITISDNDIYLLFTKDFKIDQVVHECNHAATRIVKFACGKDPKSDEFRAYVIGWLVKKVLKILNK